MITGAVLKDKIIILEYKKPLWLESLCSNNEAEI